MNPPSNPRFASLEAADRWLNGRPLKSGDLIPSHVLDWDAKAFVPNPRYEEAPFEARYLWMEKEPVK